MRAFIIGLMDYLKIIMLLFVAHFTHSQSTTFQLMAAKEDQSFHRISIKGYYAQDPTNMVTYKSSNQDGSIAINLRLHDTLHILADTMYNRQLFPSYITSDSLRKQKVYFYPLEDRFEEKDKQREHPIVDFPDRAVRYPGGNKAYKIYIDQHMTRTLKVPNGGRVILKSKVNQEGRTSDVKVLSGGTDAQRAEALRLIRHLPKVHPAERNGYTITHHNKWVVSFN